jgi:hypothetical protein
LEEGQKILKAFLERPGLEPMDRERGKAILKEFEKDSQ